MFNISLDKTASNQHCSPEDPGPKFLFYKLGLEGKRLNVKTMGAEDLLDLRFSLYTMAFPVVEFSRQGYKIRKVFG